MIMSISTILSTFSTLFIPEYFFINYTSQQLIIFVRVFFYETKDIFNYSDETDISILIILNSIVDNYYLQKLYVLNMYIKASNSS
jgi:hypothetical protein